MICETNQMQQSWFINNPLAQRVSGTIMPIFMSTRLYITTDGLQHLMGRNWLLLEDPCLTTEEFFLRCFTPNCSMSCWYTWTTVSPISCKNDVSSHGTPPTKPWRRKNDGLPAPLEHFPSPHGTLEYKSSCSGGCTARFWRFSCPWIGCFCAHYLHVTGGEFVLLSIGSPSRQRWGCVPLRCGALSWVDRP